jgi:hypothetical protein
MLLGLLIACALARGDEGGCAVRYDDPAPTCGGGEGDGKARGVGGAEREGELADGGCVIEPDVDYPGDEVRGDVDMGTDVASPRACCELCKTTEFCRFWTFSTPERGRQANYCWLKNKNVKPYRTSNAVGLVSGYFTEDKTQRAPTGAAKANAPQRPWPLRTPCRSAITLDDAFGRAIADTVRAYPIRSVIEIGSWDGTGSTTVLMQALDNVAGGGQSLTCVEVNPERHAALAALTASRPWVRTVCSQSVSRETMAYQEFEQMWRSPYNRLRYEKDVVRQWWDVGPAQATGPGFLETLTTEKWDAALIDGCEFCGIDDFRLLRDRVRVMMLDDVFHAFKCSEAHDLLCRDPAWACIWSSVFVRNGASIWVRK